MMNDLDLQLSQKLKQKRKQIKDKLTGKSSPLTTKKKRNFAKIRSAIQKKTDLDYN